VPGGCIFWFGGILKSRVQGQTYKKYI